MVLHLLVVYSVGTVSVFFFLRRSSSMSAFVALPESVPGSQFFQVLDFHNIPVSVKKDEDYRR